VRPAASVLAVVCRSAHRTVTRIDPYLPLLAVIGMATSLTGFAWLQLARVLRARSLAGLNTSTLALALVSSSLWATYAAMVSDTLTLVVALGTLPANLTVSTLLVRQVSTRREMARKALFAAPAVGLLALGGRWWGPGLVAAAGTLAVGVMIWPPAITALRERELTGVSAGAYAVRAVFGGIGWLSHFAVTADRWFLAQFLTATPPAVVVAIRAHLTNRRAPGRAPDRAPDTASTSGGEL
jgi:uncharacterized protein with PQ loop repeat